MPFWFLFVVLIFIGIWCAVGTLLTIHIKQKQLGSLEAALKTSTFLADFIEYFVFFVFIFCVALVSVTLDAQEEILVIPLATATILFALITSLIIASVRYLLRKRKKR